jgi:hypothetical protein
MLYHIVELQALHVRETQASDENRHRLFNYAYSFSSKHTPPSSTLNTNPSPSLTPIPTFQHSNLALFTTSHLCALSTSASSTQSAGANFNTSTLFTASLVVGIFCGQEFGNAGRNDVGEVDCDVSITPHENCSTRRWREVVNKVDAVARLLPVEVVEVELLRIDHTNASISSSMIEWMRRCVLL